MNECPGHTQVGACEGHFVRSNPSFSQFYDKKNELAEENLD